MRVRPFNSRLYLNRSLCAKVPPLHSFPRRLFGSIGVTSPFAHDVGRNRGGVKRRVHDGMEEGDHPLGQVFHRDGGLRIVDICSGNDGCHGDAQIGVVEMGFESCSYVDVALAVLLTAPGAFRIQFLELLPGFFWICRP